MDLWIRSQDRETMLPNPILIVDYNRILTPKNDYRDTHLILGHYKTKERALEVLDEIQQAMIEQSAKNERNELIGGLGFGSIPKKDVFIQMPKE